MQICRLINLLDLPCLEAVIAPHPRSKASLIAKQRMPIRAFRSAVPPNKTFLNIMKRNYDGC